MKKWIFLILLIAFGIFYFHKPAATWRGIPAVGDPLQSTDALPADFQHGDYTIKALAHYKITAVVLGRERYRFDAVAEIAPIDLALGWGPMSMSSMINDLHLSQSGRWYSYRWDTDSPLDAAQIAENSANTHCLPATDELRKKLLAIKRHDLVTLEGYLVEVNGPDLQHWRSSLSRKDTRGKSCEIMWITAINSQKIKTPPRET